MPEFDAVMLWAVCCLGFFGSLRAGEFTVQFLDSLASQSLLGYRGAFPEVRGWGSTHSLLETYDQSALLEASVSDVAVDFRSSPSMIWLKWKQSKTDPFRRGVDILLGCTDTYLCPVTAICSDIWPDEVRFMVRCSCSKTPLYRDRLVAELRVAFVA